MCFSWMGTQASHSPLACLLVFVWLCVYAHMRKGGVQQQQTGLISDIKQSHISGRKQTDLAVAPHLHLIQVHASQPSTSRRHPSHKDIKSRIKVIDGSLVISGY